VADLEPLLRFWRAHDALFERVEPVWWGAVVSDARFPAIREPNYARVETAEPVALSEIEDHLLPAMRRSGSVGAHAVVFRPEDQTDLIAAASTRGERITWDLVMRIEGPSEPAPDHVGEVTEPSEGFWAVHRASAALFDIQGTVTLDQMQAMERSVMVPGGRRWFTAVDAGRPVALAALMVLDGVGFVDHVVTFPDARRRGHAEALTRRLAFEAARSGAEATWLLADPEGDAVRIYERIGFERVSYLASWVSAIAGRGFRR
jgi:ribosomal protein S18 acetylase RimI-like enzyme